MQPWRQRLVVLTLVSSDVLLLAEHGLGARSAETAGRRSLSGILPIRRNGNISQRSRDSVLSEMTSCFGSRLVQPAGLRTLDHGRTAALMEFPKVLVDGRNVLDPGEVRAAGSRYEGFGQV